MSLDVAERVWLATKKGNVRFEANVRQSHLILSNAAVMWTTQVLLVVPQLILVPFLIRTIGDTGYGVYALVWSLMLAIDQLQKSLQSGVVKYSASFLAQDRIDEVNKFVSSSTVYSLLLALLASISTFAVSYFYRDSNVNITYSLIVVGVAILFTTPLTPYIAIIQSRQRYYVGAIADTASKYIGLLAILLWFRVADPSVEAAVVIVVAMLFFSRFVQIPVAYRMMPGLQNRLGLFNWGSFRLIAAFGVAIVLASLCLVANTTGIRWMMGILVSPSFVAHLAIILMPGLLLSQIIQAMTVTVMPATSSYEATGNQRLLQELLIRGMRYSTVLVLAGMFPAVLLMRKVLVIWVGADYANLAPYALILFASGSFFESTSTGHHMLKGMGKLRVIVLIYLIGLVVVPFGVILIVLQIWHNPYIAVTSGLAVGHLACGCLHIGFSYRIVGADIRVMLMRVYAQPLMIAASLWALLLCILVYGEIDGLAGLVGLSALAVTLFFITCYLFIATSAEKQQVVELLTIIRRKAAVMRRRLSRHEG